MFALSSSSYSFSHQIQPESLELGSRTRVQILVILVRLESCVDDFCHTYRRFVFQRACGELEPDRRVLERGRIICVHEGFVRQLCRSSSRVRIVTGVDIIMEEWVARRNEMKSE